LDLVGGVLRRFVRNYNSASIFSPSGFRLQRRLVAPPQVPLFPPNTGAARIHTATCRKRSGNKAVQIGHQKYIPEPANDKAAEQQLLDTENVHMITNAATRIIVKAIKHDKNGDK